MDVLSLSGAIAAARRGLIEPVLIGPAGSIEAAAAEAEIALGDFEMIDTVHSHQAAAVAGNLSALPPPLAGPARSLNARASAGKRRKAE